MHPGIQICWLCFASLICFKAIVLKISFYSPAEAEELEWDTFFFFWGKLSGIDLLKTSWGLIWFCDQEAQKSHLWNPIRLQCWHRHMTWGTYIPPSPCACLSLHGRAVLLISGIWDYCKLNLPTWELSELQSLPGKRGSDRESELSTAQNWVGQESCAWMDPRTISACSGHRGRSWAVALARNSSLQLQLVGAHRILDWELSTRTS